MQLQCHERNGKDVCNEDVATEMGSVYSRNSKILNYNNVHLHAGTCMKQGNTLNMNFLGSIFPKPSESKVEVLSFIYAFTQVNTIATNDTTIFGHVAFVFAMWKRTPMRPVFQTNAINSFKTRVHLRIKIILLNI